MCDYCALYQILNPSLLCFRSALSSVIVDLQQTAPEIKLRIPNIVSIEWASDGQTVFYTTPDAHGRPYRVYRYIHTTLTTWDFIHNSDFGVSREECVYVYISSNTLVYTCYCYYRQRIGSNEAELLFEDTDVRYYLDVSRTKDKKFVTINANSKTCSEVLESLSLTHTLSQHYL